MCDDERNIKIESRIAHQKCLSYGSFSSYPDDSPLTIIISILFLPLPLSHIIIIIIIISLTPLYLLQYILLMIEDHNKYYSCL